MVTMMLAVVVAGLLAMAMLSAQRATETWQQGLALQRQQQLILQRLQHTLDNARQVTIAPDSSMIVKGIHSDRIYACIDQRLSENNLAMHDDRYRTTAWHVRFLHHRPETKPWLEPLPSFDRPQLIEITAMLSDTDHHSVAIHIVRQLPNLEFGRPSNPFLSQPAEAIWPD